MAISIQDIDFANAAHVKGLINILSTYSAEAGGGVQRVTTEAQSNLAEQLNAFPGRHVLIALEEDGQPVGVAVCFTGFSTFKSKPVLNIHDLAVCPSRRGKGIGSALLASVETRARDLGCCKVTLEVIATNEGARRLYERSGFGNPTSEGSSLFLERALAVPEGRS